MRSESRTKHETRTIQTEYSQTDQTESAQNRGQLHDRAGDAEPHPVQSA